MESLLPWIMPANCTCNTGWQRAFSPHRCNGRPNNSFPLAQLWHYHKHRRRTYVSEEARHPSELSQLRQQPRVMKSEAKAGCPSTNIHEPQLHCCRSCFDYFVQPVREESQRSLLRGETIKERKKKITLIANKKVSFLDPRTGKRFRKEGISFCAYTSSAAISNP